MNYRNNDISSKNMLNITRDHLAKLELIKQKFLWKTCLPEPDKWKGLCNNEIWLKVIEQVMLVGSSSPANKFKESDQLKEKVSYDQLLKIKDHENQLKKVIYDVLRAVKTRYVNASVEKCRKTKALVHNFKVLSEYKEAQRASWKKSQSLVQIKRRLSMLLANLNILKVRVLVIS